MKRYIATMEHHGRTDPINHGLVDITDDGFLPCGTPIEDFGMFMVRDKPFTQNIEKLKRFFIRLIQWSDRN